MVMIPTPEGNYCIDQTEVTQSQYAAFLATKPATKDHSVAWCQTANQGYEPKIQDDTGQGSCLVGAVDVEKKGEWPMVCVDWCDAYAYCAWAGKRLCGSRQGAGLALKTEPSSLDGQWEYACTNGGTSTFSTGQQPDGQTCAPGGDSPVSSHQECRGAKAPFSGIYSLTGGVSEWEDSCNDEPVARDCSVRTGSPTKECTDRGEYSAANSGIPGLGFRCCAD